MKRMLLGVGNRLSHDDGAGPILAERLAGTNWLAIDCGTSLENAAGIVSRERPDLLVIADAARMGLPAGTVRRLSPPSVDRMLISTHGLPLSFFLDRISATAAETVILGIEPADLSFGEGLSPMVDEVLGRLDLALRRGEEGLGSIPWLETNPGAEGEAQAS